MKTVDLEFRATSIVAGVEIGSFVGNVCAMSNYLELVGHKKSLSLIYKTKNKTLRLLIESDNIKNVACDYGLRKPLNTIAANNGTALLKVKRIN